MMDLYVPMLFKGQVSKLDDNLITYSQKSGYLRGDAWFFTSVVLPIFFFFL